MDAGECEVEKQLAEQQKVEHKIAKILCASDNSPLCSSLREWACIAATDMSVMIHGETGVGKEVLARTFHNFSARTNGPFVAVNCGALPDNLLESELFGVKKGAFTGANCDISGKIPAAHKGTLFLDEVGELSLKAQKKLLRVLQEKQVSAVGEVEERPVDFRLVTASHRNLMAMVRAGSFREDLYYRIVMYQADLPPLRARPMDLPALVKAMGFGNVLLSFQPAIENLQNDHDSELVQRLQGWQWPGNIRELRNVLERIRALGAIGKNASEVFAEHRNMQQKLQHDLRHSRQVSVRQQQILAAMEDSAWNQSRAAISLGISRGSLQYQLRKLSPNPHGGLRAKIYGRDTHNPATIHPI